MEWKLQGVAMNYLAHAVLSFGDPAILVGNMISDHVKGKQVERYTPAIQRGIRLHRAIDTFTDDHPATQELKAIFRPAYRLYAGAFVDIVYDHFLALDTRQFTTPDDLRQFADVSYATLDPFVDLFPERFARMFPYMKSQDWFYHYRDRGGIRSSFGGLVRRAAYLTESDQAFILFEANYEKEQEQYQRFFPELWHYSRQWLQEHPLDH